MNDFFGSLQQEVRPRIDRILQHPFLRRIHDGWLNRMQLQYFALQYWHYCSYFPRFLCACAAQVPDDPSRLPLIQNLWEEHGSGNLEGSHRMLFARFCRALGLESKDLQEVEPLPSTSICVENMMALCSGPDFLTSLGALSIGTEYFTSEEYKLIETGLKSYDFLTPEDYHFWTAHISMDEVHYSEMLHAIEPWLKEEGDYDRIRNGAERAIDLELLFWDGLEDHLPMK